MRGWIVNYARKHYWRVASPAFDLEDLVQEGYICYCRCLEKYGHEIEQRHLMALVKRTFANRVNDLSSVGSKNKSVRSTALSDLARDDGEVSVEEIAGVEPEEATFRVLLSQLPRELKELVQTLLSDAKGLEFERQPREPMNAWLCRLAGLPSRRYDVEGTLRRHFGLEESAQVPRGAGEYVYAGGELLTR